jgi:hypothetical protein
MKFVFYLPINIKQFLIYGYILLLVIYPVVSTIYFGVFPSNVVPVDPVILSEILSDESSTLNTESKPSTEEFSFGGSNNILAVVLFCLSPSRIPC